MRNWPLTQVHWSLALVQVHPTYHDILLITILIRDKHGSAENRYHSCPNLTEFAVTLAKINLIAITCLKYIALIFIALLKMGKSIKSWFCLWYRDIWGFCSRQIYHTDLPNDYNNNKKENKTKTNNMDILWNVLHLGLDSPYGESSPRCRVSHKIFTWYHRSDRCSCLTSLGIIRCNNSSLTMSSYIFWPFS